MPKRLKETMIRSDFHMHTAFSTDSEEAVESMLNRAVERGLYSVCITDHMDADYPPDDELSVEDLKEPLRVFAKIRYNHKGAWCTVERTKEDEVTCCFEEPQRAVTPGQAIVFYDGEYVLGGGTIL